MGTGSHFHPRARTTTPVAGNGCLSPIFRPGGYVSPPYLQRAEVVTNRDHLHLKSQIVISNGGHPALKCVPPPDAADNRLTRSAGRRFSACQRSNCSCWASPLPALVSKASESRPGRNRMGLSAILRSQSVTSRNCGQGERALDGQGAAVRESPTRKSPARSVPRHRRVRGGRD